MKHGPEYEGVENLGAFTGPQLDAYRKMLLEKTQEFADLIEAYLVTPRDYPIDVLEVGSGNGRLIIELERRGAIDSLGVGVDLSESRTWFAQLWAHQLGFCLGIDFMHGDFLEVDLGDYPPFDLAVCVTGCLNYFPPLNKTHDLITKMKLVAEHSLFEIYHYPKGVESGKINGTTQLLAAEDPWDVYHHRWLPLEKPGWFHHIKTFSKHDGTTDMRSEFIKYFTHDEAVALIETYYDEIELAYHDETRTVILAR